MHSQNRKKEFLEKIERIIRLLKNNSLIASEKKYITMWQALEKADCCTE